MSEEKSKSATPGKPVAKVLLEKAGVLTPQDTVQTAGQKMRATGQESLPVAENRKLVGTVSDANADQKAARYGHDPARTTIAESMNREIIFCFEDEDCATALERMDKHHVEALPVVDREMRIVGMLSREDLAGSVGKDLP